MKPLGRLASGNKRGEKSDGLGDLFPHITQTLPQGYAPTWPFWVERYVEGGVRVVLHLRWVGRERNVVNLCAVFERQVAGLSGQSVGGVMTGVRTNIKTHINPGGNEIEGVVFVLNV